MPNDEFWQVMMVTVPEYQKKWLDEFRNKPYSDVSEASENLLMRYMKKSTSPDLLILDFLIKKGCRLE